MNKTFDSIRNCKKCALYLNQLPLIMPCYCAEVIWVGLSSVKVSDQSDFPLSPNTNSGNLISSIEFFLPNISFYRTNVVKCLPLENNKIRYPFVSEMDACFSHLKMEIDYFKPKVIFLLGKQVANFVLKNYSIKNIELNDNFIYEIYKFNEIIFIPIHHPSFILVYKRKKLSAYIENIENIIKFYITTIHHDSAFFKKKETVKAEALVLEPDLL